MAIINGLLCILVLCLEVISFGETIIISPGDERVIPVSTAWDAQVSRKGVIDLQNDGYDTWVLRGLRAGVVVIRWFNHDGIEVERAMVEVINPDKRLPAFPDWACKLQSVDCDRERRLLKGVFQSAKDWLQAKSWCQQSMDCWFDADLSPSARIMAERLLYVRAAQGRWSIEQGRVVHSGACQTESIEQVKRELGPWVHAVDKFQCTSPPNDRFLVRLKLVAMNRDTASKIGLDVQRGTIIPHPKEAWKVLARSMRANNQVEIIGEPSLVVQKGTTAKMSSGGEFQVFYDSAGEKGTIREGWKKYGLTFEVHSLKDGLLEDVVNLVMHLTSKSSAGEGTLGSYSLESQISLVNQSKYLLSVATVSRKSQGEHSLFSLGRIPILGPLLKVVDNEDLHQYLSIWAFVDRESN